MITRRRLLAGAAVLGSGLLVRPARAQEQAVRPRADWGADLPPLGPLPAEASGDVRLLLVHHSAGVNEYGASDVPGILRAVYHFHTGSKGWPDVAYNFFVDRYGGVWEGRTGSLAAPIQADATGGSQGFAQLCCLLGTFTDVPPTAEAQSALVGLLARLADTYGVDTSPGATTTFVSRGSNRWPAGTEVTATTIAGHRDMSQTACPGDAVYARIADGTLAAEVTARRTGVVATTTTVAPTTTTVPATTATTAPTTTTVPASTATTVPSTTSSSAVATTTSTAVAAAGPTVAVVSAEGPQRSGPAVLAAVGAACVVAATLAIRRRRA